MTTTESCTHYIRQCDIECPECLKFYSCRICHDEAEDHILKRKEMKNIRCRACQKIQTSNNHYCESNACQIRFGEYFCQICHLWGDNLSHVYHCEQCGICRKGPKEDFIHCQQCNICHRNHDYKCNQGTKSDMTCSICLDNLFTSTRGTHQLHCGHILHINCLNEYIHSDYRCPICHKTMYDRSMEWAAMKMYVDSDLMPHPYNNWQAEIQCNDCQMKSTIKFHIQFLGCRSCGSFNTQKLRLIQSDEPIVQEESISEPGQLSSDDDGSADEFGESAESTQEHLLTEDAEISTESSTQ